jgi:hypothetical protein
MIRLISLKKTVNINSWSLRDSPLGIISSQLAANIWSDGYSQRNQNLFSVIIRDKEWFDWRWRTVDRSIATAVRLARWASVSECGPHFREKLHSPSFCWRISLIVCVDWRKCWRISRAIGKGNSLRKSEKVFAKSEEEGQTWIDLRTKGLLSRRWHTTLWFKSSSKLESRVRLLILCKSPWSQDLWEKIIWRRISALIILSGEITQPWHHLGHDYNLLGSVWHIIENPSAMKWSSIYILQKISETNHKIEKSAIINH